MAAWLLPALFGSIAAGAGIADYKSAKKSVESMERQKAESQAYIEKQLNRSRGEVFKLFGSAQQSRQEGIQAGLSLYRQMVPAQLNSFRQGNMNAQNQIIRGMPQVQNAILGNPIDYSAFQATPITGLAGLQMPTMRPGEDLAALLPQQTPPAS